METAVLIPRDPSLKPYFCRPFDRRTSDALLRKSPKRPAIPIESSRLPSSDNCRLSPGTSGGKGEGGGEPFLPSPLLLLPILLVLLVLTLPCLPLRLPPTPKLVVVLRLLPLLPLEFDLLLLLLLVARGRLPLEFDLTPFLLLIWPLILLLVVVVVAVVVLVKPLLASASRARWVVGDAVTISFSSSIFSVTGAGRTRSKRSSISRSNLSFALPLVRLQLALYSADPRTRITTALLISALASRDCAGFSLLK